AAGAWRRRARRDVPRVQHGRRPGAGLRLERRAACAEHGDHGRRAGRVPTGVRDLGRTERPLRVQKGSIGILISGRGSNLQAIIDATARGDLDASIAVVISNRADAPGLGRARDAGLAALYLNPRDSADRDAYDRAVADAFIARGVTLVCLAGYMRL